MNEVLAAWPFPQQPTVDVEGATPALTGRQVQIVPVRDGCHRVFVDGVELLNVRAVRIRMAALEVPIVELEGAELRDLEPPACAPEA